MKTAVGPTQGAERHTNSIDRWQARPGLARALRIAIFLLPLIISVLFTWAAGRIFPPEEVGLGRWTWIGVVFVLANVLLTILRRLTARLLPLVALMKLTLVFPDQAPSRMKSTLRRSNSRKLLREISEAEARGETTQEVRYGEYLVQLLADLNDHDRLTRGHSERVRVYCEMLGEEMRLSDDEMNKLRWSALLHDVGKLSVPPEILNKPGRPTEDEWKILSGHPAAAREMLAPLRPWLGDWVHSADQHHCRWDGKGYPEKLAGTDISFAGRLVAIADAYDVMTSARSYKKPLSVELARQELTECAGSQFDPTMVRTFLGISLGRLRTVGGPLAWLINLTGSAQIPAPIAGTVTSTAFSATAASAGVVAASAAALISPTPEPDLLAFNDPVVEVYDIEASIPEDGGPTTFDIRMSAPEGRPIVSVTLPASGVVEVISEPEPTGEGDEWVATVVYTPDPDYVGEDGFEIEACIEDICDAAVVSIEVFDTNELPIATDDAIATAADSSVLIDVLANDLDIDGTLELVAVSRPDNGATEIVDGAVRYTPAAGFDGTDSFTYTIRDDAGDEATALVIIDVIPDSWASPTAVDDAGIGFVGTEDTSFITADVTANDATGDGARPDVELATEPENGSVIDNGDGTFTYSPSPDTFGTDSFSYTIEDSRGLRATGTVTIDIEPVADRPVSEPDGGIGFATTEDAPLRTGNVLANDRDADQELTASNVLLLSEPLHGTLINNGDGTFDYIPSPDFNGTDSFTYLISDDTALASATTTVTIVVEPENDPPNAVDDSFATDEDASFNTPDITSNDTDPDLADGVVATITIVDDVQYGSLAATGNGTFDYTPNADFHGTDQFTYTLTDPDGLVSEPAVVTLEVRPVNDAPIAGADEYGTREATALEIDDLVANDTDLEDVLLAPTSVIIVDEPSNGTVEVDADGTVIYTPEPGFHGADTFTYAVIDSGLVASEPATVTVTVSEVNDPPVAADDSGAGYGTSEDTPFTTPDVTANDTDLQDGSADPSTLQIVAPPSLGTVTHNGDGTFDYTPDPDVSGGDSFTYTIDDSRGATSEPAVVKIDVTPVNDAPISLHDDGTGFATDEDTPFTTADVTANDSDLEDGSIAAVTVIVESTTTDGTLVNNGDGTFDYTPDPDFTGIDRFTYTIADNEGLRSAATEVLISVGATNDAPVAAADNGVGFVTEEDVSFITADVTANDTDIEDGAIDRSSVNITRSPALGTATSNGDGTITYTPDADANGTDTFDYTVRDSEGAESAPATVTIAIAPSNDAPIADDDSGPGFTTDEDVPFTTDDITTNDSDVEDASIDPATITIVTTTQLGTLVENGDGTFDYIPDPDAHGADSFTYEVSDSNGAVSNVATVEIFVASVNDAPNAVDDSYEIKEDNLLPTIDPAANDTDVEDGAVSPSTVTIVTTTSNGTLSANGDGTFSYLGDLNWFGTDTFTYTVTDAAGTTSAPATVTITVTPVNDPPVANDDIGAGFTTDEDVPFLTASILANDGDAEDASIDPSLINIVTDAQYGTVVHGSSGRLEYRPNDDFHGIDVLTYTVTDSDGAVSEIAEIVIEVRSVNDAPVAVDDQFETAEDVAVTTTPITANDEDAEDSSINPATISLINDVTNGVLQAHGDGTYTYTPDPDFVGIDGFTYVVTDGQGLLSNTALVRFIVTPVNDPPVANDDEGNGFTTDEDTPFTTFDVTNNDLDIEDGAVDPQTIVIVTQPANGTITNNLDGTFDYLPTADLNGTDSFTYTVKDFQGAVSEPATVTITVLPVNDPPVAADDSGVGFVTPEDTLFTTFDVTLNDDDLEDGVPDASTVTVMQDVTNGTLTNVGDGTFIYSPALNFNGTDTFTYVVSDSNGGTSNEASVTIQVTAGNDPPVATGDSFSVDEDTPLETTDITVNDFDAEDPAIDPATVAVVTGPANGTLVNQGDGTFVYTPDPDFNGIDFFEYRVSDSGLLLSNIATVTIVVVPVNDPPVALDDAGASFTTDEEVTFTTGDVTANDGDVEDASIDPATLQIVQGATHGSATHNGDGTFTYVPALNFTGTDTFIYTVDDSDGATSNTAVVSITVTEVNDPPVALDDFGVGFVTIEDVPFTTGDITANDSDLEDGTVDPATVVFSQPLGSLAHNGDGTFSYTPPVDWSGNDSFSYTVEDSNGEVSAPAVVTITVTPVNDPPVAGDDGGAGYSTTEDTPLLTPSVLLNDSDVEDGSIDPLTVAIVADPGSGTADYNGDGTFTYFPAQDFSGVATFTYQVTDSNGASSVPATVTIVVTPVNDPPVAGDDAGPTFTTSEDTPFTTGSVLDNDADVEDGSISPSTIFVETQPQLGHLFNNGDGTFVYTPDANAFGQDSFSYWVSDSDGAPSNVATVTITITPVNDAPDVVNPGPQVGHVTELFELPIIATDIDGDNLSYSATGLPAGVEMHPDGTIGGTPSVNGAGMYSVTVDVTDDGVPAITTSITFDLNVLLWNVSDLAGVVPITEVLTRSSTSPTNEFIELYNAGASSIDIAGWMVTDSNLRVEGPGHINFNIPSTDHFGRPAVLDPGEHAVVWVANSGWANPANGLHFVFNPGGGEVLHSGGDDVWLLDTSLRIIDYVSWGSGNELYTPPPTELDLWDFTWNNTLVASSGQSLSLTPHGLDTNTSACWERTTSGDAAGRCAGWIPTQDSDGLSWITSFSRNNNHYVADAGGPYAITEGDDLALDGSGTSGTPTLFEWDLDDDGDYDDASGETPTVPWMTLDALGINDNGSYPIHLRVDGIGFDSTTLTINNLPPQLVTTGAQYANDGEPYTLELGIEDPGDDTVYEWIINWGDGSIEIISGNPSSVTHVYAQPGNYNILASAKDEDGDWIQNEFIVPSYDDFLLHRYDGTTGNHLQSFPGPDKIIQTAVGPDGLLYVSSDQDSTILRYDAYTGAFVDTFVSAGSGGLDGAEGFDWGPDGHLYVANWNGKNILRFNRTTGAFIDVFATQNIDNPYAVSFGPDGMLYVGEYNDDEILRFNAQTGAFVDVFVAAGAWGLKEPERITWGPDGDLYVSEFSDHSVLRFDGTTGVFVQTVVQGGSQVNLQKATGLEFGPDGHLYVGGYDSNNVLRMLPDGTNISNYVSPAAGGLDKPTLFTWIPGQQVIVN